MIEAPCVTDLEGRRPLVRDEDVVVFGRRGAADAEEHGSQASRTPRSR
jgi:arginase